MAFRTNYSVEIPTEVGSAGRELGFLDTTANDLDFLSTPIAFEVTVSYELHVTVGVLLAVFGLLGTVGNGMLIYIFLRSKTRHHSASMLVVNLSTADCLMSLSSPIVASASFNGSWQLGEIGCALYTIVVGTTGLVSIVTMATIAVDRYVVIARLTQKWGRSSSRCPQPSVTMVIFMTWVYSLVWNLLPLGGWGSYIVEDYGTSCSFKYLSSDLNTQSYVLALFIGGFAIPLVVLCVCYFLIFRYVSHHERELCKFTGSSPKRSIRITSQGSPKVELQIAKVSMVIVVCYCIAWLPFAIVSLLGAFGYGNLITLHVQMLPAMFAKISPLYNPVIYGTGHPVVKRTLRNMCCQRKGHVASQPTATRARLSLMSGSFTGPHLPDERSSFDISEMKNRLKNETEKLLHNTALNTCTQVPNVLETEVVVQKEVCL